MSRYYPLLATVCAALGVLLIWSTGIQSALFAPAGSGGEPMGTARVRLDETRHDLGTLAAGKPARATFRVANEGTHRLVIRRVTGNCCGRGGPPEPPTIVPPGESRQLVVELDTTGIQGGLQRDITYATNDPRMPRFELTVVGRVGQQEWPQD